MFLIVAIIESFQPSLVHCLLPLLFKSPGSRLEGGGGLQGTGIFFLNFKENENSFAQSGVNFSVRLK